MQFLDKRGWLAGRVKGRPVVNVIRLLLWTRKILRGTWSRIPNATTLATMDRTDRGEDLRSFDNADETVSQSPAVVQ